MTAQPFRDDALEFALLGGALSDPAMLPKLAGMVSAEDFAHPSHAFVWECLVCFDVAHTPATLDLLEAELRTRSRYNTVAQQVQLAALPHMKVQWATLESYAKRVGALAAARRGLAVCERAAKPSAGASPEAYADAVLSQVSAAVQRRGALSAPEMSEAVMEFDSYLQERLERAAQGAGPSGLSTGLLAVDRQLGGLEPGQLILVAGRPSMGKTSLVTGMTVAAAEQDRGHVLFFSCEMPRREIVTRLCCGRAGVDSQNVKAGAITEDEVRRLYEAQQWVSTLRPLRIYDQTPMRVEDIRAAALRAQATGPVALVVIDYLAMLSIPPLSKNENQDQLFGRATKALKELAKELGCAVILLAQLNRDCEKRANKRPLPSDLRSSGELEAHADTILFVYRDAVYNDDAIPTAAEIIVSKQRAGATGVCDVAFDEVLSSFRDAREDEIPQRKGEGNVVPFDRARGRSRRPEPGPYVADESEVADDAAE